MTYMRGRRVAGGWSGEDDGFTLIEVLVVTVLMGLIMGIAFFGWRSWQQSLQEQGAQRAVVSLLRDAQVRSVAEDTTYCVDFGSSASTTTATVWRVPGNDTGAVAACTTGTRVQGWTADNGSRVTGASFTQRDSTTTAFVLFYPRGAASGGSLSVARNGSTKTYSITVDALTGRVSSSGS